MSDEETPRCPNCNSRDTEGPFDSVDPHFGKPSYECHECGYVFDETEIE